MLTADLKLRKCKDLRHLPLVEITWRDAAVGGGWGSLAYYRANNGTSQVSTVGYLTKNSKFEIQVVQSISIDGNVADSMSIPKAWICRTRRLR